MKYSKIDTSKWTLTKRMELAENLKKIGFKYKETNEDNIVLKREGEVLTIETGNNRKD